MKLSNPTKITIALFLLFCLNSHTTMAQDSSAIPTVMAIRYMVPINQVPYLSVNTKKKVGRKFEPVKGISFSVYFNDTSNTNLLGKTVTGINGEGKVAFPARFKATWDSLTSFKFIAICLQLRSN